MSAIEDTRKVLQDFLAPELRELKTRLDALEKRMDERFDNSEKLEKERFDNVTSRFSQVDERFKAGERNAELRHAALIAEIKGVSNYNDLRERVAKIESSLVAVHQ